MTMKFIIYRKSLFLSFFLFYVSHLSFGQSNFSSYDISTGFSSYWPASLSASQLFRKSAEKIDYATGRATIRIPLYEIRTADFVLPISIYFSTGGITTNQLAGQLGAGWQLEAEPMITRQVRGMPDEFYFLADSAAHHAQNNESYLLRLVNGQADCQQDIFYYRLLSGSSSFILEESSGRYFRPHLLVQGGALVTVPTGCVSSDFSNPISVTDLSGNRYVFGQESSARELTFQGGYESVTSWKASEIISPRGDRISFSYWDKAPQEYPSTRYDFYRVEDNLPPLTTDSSIPPHPGYWVGINGKKNYYYMSGTDIDPNSGIPIATFKKWDKVNDVPYSTPGSRISPRPVQRINFAGGSVRFSYSTATGLLERMDVYSADDVIRSVRFTMTSTYLPFLSKVEILGSDGKSIGCYQLGYTPYKEGDTEEQYNRGIGNQWIESLNDLVPTQDVLINRDSDHQSFRFSLGKGGNTYFPRYRGEDLYFVIYPSGGRTEYEYENGFVHTPIGSPLGAEVGVNRLASIIEYPVCGIPVTREFRYGDTESLNGVGYARFPIDNSAFMQEYKLHYILCDKLGRYSSCSCRARLYTNQNLLNGDCSIYYPFVQETVNGISTLHHFPCYSSFQQGVEPRYSEPIGNAQYLSLEDSCARCSNGRFLSIRYFSRRFVRKMVSELKTTALFENINNMQEVVGQSLSIKELFLGSYLKGDVEVLQVEPGEVSYHEKNLDGHDVASNSKVYTYSGSFPDLLLSMSTDRERVEFSYPGDDLSKAAHVLMKANNEQNIPVEICHYVDGVLRKRLVYDYEPDERTVSGYSLSAICESTDVLGNSLRVVEQYSQYLRCGKPSQVTRQDGTTVGVVWGYGGLHPIAFVEGMTANAIASAGISLEEVACSHTIDEGVYKCLNNLRHSNLEARVTTFRYFPMIGMAQRTEPDGRSETYSYDAGARLSKIENNQRKTITTYEYHEANQ